MRQLSAAIQSVDDTNLIGNIGQIVQTVSKAHLLPANLASSAFAVAGFDVGSFAQSVTAVTNPALKAIRSLKFDTVDEVDGYQDVATSLYITTSVAQQLSSWQRVNDAPHPDLGILDALLGDGSAGSGTSWIVSQVNASSLTKVVSACKGVHAQMIRA